MSQFGGPSGLMPNYQQPLGGFNPLQALGGLIQPFVQPFQNFFTTQSGNWIPSTPANRDQLDAFYNSLIATGLDPAAAKTAVDSIYTGGDPTGKTPLSAAQSFLGERQKGQTQLGVLEGAYQPAIGRFEKILGSDPNAVRTDAEYGNLLGQLENQINAGAAAQKQNAATAQARSGGGSLSGIANRNAIGAETGRNLGLQSALSGIKGVASSNLQGLRGEYAQNRNAILGGMPTDIYGLTTGVPSSEFTARYGMQTMPIDKAIGYGLAGLSALQNGQQQMFSTIASIPSLVKGFKG